MPGLSAAATLDLWERAAPLSPVERALEMAAAVGPDRDVDTIARLPVGRRDARLLRLRADLAGDMLEAITTCPACGERIEFTTDVAALSASGSDVTPPRPIELDGHAVAWRSPDSLDVAAAAATGSAVGAERVLLERCILSVSGSDGSVVPVALPPSVRQAVVAAMAEADPLAEVLVGLTCPACTTTFSGELDVATFVWAEVKARAQRVLREVAALAAAYGWTEDQVLVLSEGRRTAYLALAGEAAT